MQKYSFGIVSKSGKMFWYKTPHTHRLRAQAVYTRVPRTGTSSMHRIVIDTLPEYFTEEVEVYDLRRDSSVGPPLRVVVYTLTDKYKASVTAAVRALHESGMCKRRQGKMYGKSFTFPREELLVSEYPLEYRFSGGCLEAVTADSVKFKELFDIANSLAQEGEAKFKGVLVNVYREQKDRVSPHRDKDVTDDEWTGVVCVSIGDSRILRVEADPKVPGSENFEGRTDIEVGDGKVYVMEGQRFQKYMKHEVRPPCKTQPFDVRWSLTFRRFLLLVDKKADTERTSAEKETPDAVNKKADTERKRTHTSAEKKTPDAVDEKADTEPMPKRAATKAPAK